MKKDFITEVNITSGFVKGGNELNGWVATLKIKVWNFAITQQFYFDNEVDGEYIKEYISNWLVDKFEYKQPKLKWYQKLSRRKLNER